MRQSPNQAGPGRRERHNSSNRKSSDIWRRKGRRTSPTTPSWLNSSESLGTVKLRSRPQAQKLIGSGLFCLRKRANWRSCRRTSQRRKRQSGSWSSRMRQRSPWTKSCLDSSPRYTQATCSRRKPEGTPDSERLSGSFCLLRQQESPRRQCKWTWRTTTRTVRIRKLGESWQSSIVERDQACAGIAERESRALLEAKLKRQRQCGESTPLPGPMEGPAPPTPRAGATPRGVVAVRQSRGRLGATRKEAGAGWGRG